VNRKINNPLEEETHDSIMCLDHKLKALLVEIETKRASLSTEKVNDTVQQQRLTELSTEVKKALSSMEAVVRVIENG
jgi:hypothetical protein